MCELLSTQIGIFFFLNQNNLLSILGADEACIPAIATQGVLCSRL